VDAFWVGELKKNGLFKLKVWGGKKILLRGLTFIEKVFIVVNVRKRKTLIT